MQKIKNKKTRVYILRGKKKKERNESSILGRGGEEKKKERGIEKREKKKKKKKYFNIIQPHSVGVEKKKKKREKRGRGEERGGVRGEGIALLSGIFRRIRDGIVACPVPMQS